MPRRRQHRWVAAAPAATFFKPQGTSLGETEAVVLPVEGLEALRLADLEGLCAEAAAEAMGVSRHTFGRVLAQARRATAAALVGGRALRIEGGSYRLAGEASHRPEDERTGSVGCNVGGSVEEDSDMAEQGQGGRCGRAGPGRGGLGGKHGGQGQGGQDGQGRGQGSQSGPSGQRRGRGLGRGQGRGEGGGRGRTAAVVMSPEAAPRAEPVASKALERLCPTCGAACEGAFCPGCGASMGA